MDRFVYFIMQDYVYLLDFGQVLCHAGSKSPDLKTLELFARHALGAVEVERGFHESFGKFAVTVEPAAGVEKPTGPMVLLGNV